jgi:GTP pyrophosphokinase
MIENLAQILGSLPQVVDALAEQQRACGRHPALPPHLFEVSQYAAITLCDWELPSALSVAVLLSPLLAHHFSSEEGLERRFGHQALLLAKQLVTWSASISKVDKPDEHASSTYYSMLLRRLLRQAYLDLPHLSLVLLLMAEHDAYLSLRPKEVAALTEAAFIPLVSILGMWRVRRQWLDKSLSVLYPNDYAEITRLMREVGLAAREGGSNWAQHESLVEQMNISPEERRKRRIEQKTAQERDRIYEDVKELLVNALQQEGLALTSIQPKEPSIGTFLYRCQRGDSKEELINRLRIRVECATRQDCYRLLDIVHRLGTPLTPRFSEHFCDYIASPNPNGYRALHTSIGYRHDTNGITPVDFRILTGNMHHVNERGVLATLPHHSTQVHERVAWWNKLDEQSDEFCRRRVILERSDIGTRSNRLYVFTPQGEVVYQKDGSTALDFAYSIHTDLGHHALKIEINNKPVPHNYPLHNGDWIQIHYDPYFTGPDWSWLSAVQTASARHKIRQGLLARARVIHQGRQKIEDILLRLVQSYKKERKYELTLSTARLDTFLSQVVQIHHLSDLGALYEEVAAERISPHKIAQHFISTELSAALVDENGASIAYPAYRIHFCDRCRPVPGEMLIAFETPRQTLKIHQAKSKNCLNQVRQSRSVPIYWAEVAQTKNTELTLFQVEVEDRSRILGDVLHSIYSEPGAYLHSVEAQKDSHGNAHITLLVEANNLKHVVNMQTQIEMVHGVRRVLAGLPSPSQFWALQTPVKEVQRNPYTYQEVYDRLRFYDRQEPIDAILRWLDETPPTDRLILHGQRRVGKTSLAKYLIHEILPECRVARPVWIDFQDLTRFTAQSIVQLIVQSVYDVLQKPLPLQGMGEEPTLWLNRALEEAISERHASRLLLIIDEFNALLDAEQKGHLSPVVFANLRSVMSKRRDLNWLLIVQDTHFQNPASWGSVAPLFQQSRPLHLLHLDPHWANKLILEPAQRAGMLYEEALPAAIMALTNGNPYLIQVLCHELLQRVIKLHRMNITADDLNHVVNLFTSEKDGSRIFHHFVHCLKPIEKIVLAAIAHSSSDGDWVNIADVLPLIRHKEERLLTEVLRSTIKGLERQGILALRSILQKEQIRIPIHLFCNYVAECIDIQGAIEEWKTY